MAGLCGPYPAPQVAGQGLQRPLVTELCIETKANSEQKKHFSVGGPETETKLKVLEVLDFKPCSKTASSGF